MELLRDSYFRDNYCFGVILEQLLVYSRKGNHSTEHPENSYLSGTEPGVNIVLHFTKNKAILLFY